MFAHIRKHQKWLMVVFSSAVIVSFVWYFNPAARNNRKYGMRGGSDEVVGMVYGQPMQRSKYVEIYHEAELFHLMYYHEWPRNDEASRQLQLLEKAIREQTVLIHEIDAYDIQVSDEAVADWIATVLRSPDTKAFSPEYYNQFLGSLAQHGVKKSDFERFARHQVGIEHLRSLAAIPGKLVTPQEGESAYREENAKADTKIVFFNATNYLAQVQVKPEGLAAFYTNRASSYRLPERIQLTYVAFAISNYFPQAELILAKETNLTTQIDKLYAERGDKFYTDATGQVMTPEAAKAKIRQEVVDETARREARQTANAFTEKLLAITNNVPLERLEKAAQENGLAAKVTEPFGKFESPKGMNVPDQFSKVAFALTPEEPIYEEPIVGEDEIYVVAFKNKIPSQLPPLASIQAKVETDFRQSESQKLEQEAGRAFATAVTNALAAGKTFDQAAKDAGYASVDLPPFAHNARTVDGIEGRADSASVRSTAFSIRTNQASWFVSSPSRESGYVLFLENLIPVPQDEVQKNLSTFLDDLRRKRASSAFNDWFEKEMMVAQLKLPGENEKRGQPSAE